MYSRRNAVKRNKMNKFKDVNYRTITYIKNKLNK